jgi:DNA-binding SARP family transcriptional activator
MQVEMLGALTMVTANGRLRIPGEKVRTTLAMLALNAGKMVSCDALVDELWGELPVGNAKNALQAHIKRLRKLMDRLATEGRYGYQLIQTVDNGYVLELPREAVDANRFLDLAAQGARCLDSRPGEAVQLLERALQLWHGPALVDIGEGIQCRSAASWLDESRVIAKEDLITARLALGDERSIVSELDQLVARYPLRERFTEQFMLALYRCGRQADALDVYHRIRERLTMDLGLEPGQLLQQRYQAILAQDPALVASV